MRGGTVVQWLAMSPHSKKILEFMWMLLDTNCPQQIILKDTPFITPAHPSDPNGSPNSTKAAQELPKDCDKELKVLMWPQYFTNPNLIEHPLKKKNGIL